MTNIRRRLFAPPLTDSLPSGYTKIEYIETNIGTFLMNIESFPTDVVVLDYKFNEIPETQRDSVASYIYKDAFRSLGLENYSSWSADNVYIYHYNNQNFEIGEDDYGDPIFASPSLDRRTVALSYQGAFYESFYPSSTLENVYIGLSEYPDGGWAGIHLLSLKLDIYNISIIDPLSGYRHYMVPCINNSNQNGLYDVIDNVFYPYFIGNQITGSLVGGNLTSQYPVNQDITLSFSATSDFSNIRAEYTIPQGSNYVSTEKSTNLRYCSISPKTDGVYYYEWATY